jgi:nitrite reductase/ring-hydroxylating ferredoxin subunit
MKKLLLITGLVLAGFGCGKGGNVLPYVAVNFEAPLTDPRLSALNAPGGVVLISGYGVAGLILYREPDGTYAAYDRCSTYKPQNLCAVTLNSGHLVVTDPCSGSEWSLYDGTPVKGPASKSLQSYNVSVSNYELFVSN